MATQPTARTKPILTSQALGETTASAGGTVGAQTSSTRTPTTTCATDHGGLCGYTAEFTCNNGGFISGKCPGAASIQCCKGPNPVLVPKAALTPTPTPITGVATAPPTHTYIQQGPTRLVNVVDMGGSGCTAGEYDEIGEYGEKALCNACEGDCDSDDDCRSGLKCYQRKTHMATVPGCAATGYVTSINGNFGYNEDHDYCFDPGAGPCGGPDLSFVLSREECIKAAAALNLRTAITAKSWPTGRPKGCSFLAGGAFVKPGTGSSQSDTTPLFFNTGGDPGTRPVVRAPLHHPCLVQWGKYRLCVLDRHYAGAAQW